MRNIVRTCLIILLLSLLSTEAGASSDFRLWFEGGIRYKITKKLRFGFDQHFRLMDDASDIESISPDVHIRYRLLKYLRIGGGYRFIIEPLKRDGATRVDLSHRFYGDVILRNTFKKQRITLSYRLRYQEQIVTRKGVRDTVRFRHTVRNKLQFDLRIKKWAKPFLNAEVFIRFGDPDGYLHKWRVGTGAKFMFKKAHEFTVSFRGEQFLDGSGDKAAIASLGYHYHF